MKRSLRILLFFVCFTWIHLILGIPEEEVAIKQITKPTSPIFLLFYVLVLSPVGVTVYFTFYYDCIIKVKENMGIFVVLGLSMIYYFYPLYFGLAINSDSYIPPSSNFFTSRLNMTTASGSFKDAFVSSNGYWDALLIYYDTSIDDFFYYWLRKIPLFRRFLEFNILLPTLFLLVFICKNYVQSYPSSPIIEESILNGKVSHKKKRPSSSSYSFDVISHFREKLKHKSTMTPLSQERPIRRFWENFEMSLKRYYFIIVFVFVALVAQHLFIQLAIFYGFGASSRGQENEIINFYNTAQKYTQPLGEFIVTLIALSISNYIYYLHLYTLSWSFGFWYTIGYLCVFFLIKRTIKVILTSYSKCVTILMLFIIAIPFSFLDLSCHSNLQDVLLNGFEATRFINLYLNYVISNSAPFLCLAGFIIILYYAHDVFHLFINGWIDYLSFIYQKDFRITQGYGMIKWKNKVLKDLDMILPLPIAAVMKNSTRLLCLTADNIININTQTCYNTTLNPFLGLESPQHLFTDSMRGPNMELSFTEYKDWDIWAANNLFFWIHSTFRLHHIFQLGLVIPIYFLSWMMSYAYINYIEAYLTVSTGTTFDMALDIKNFKQKEKFWATVQVIKKGIKIILSLKLRDMFNAVIISFKVFIEMILDLIKCINSIFNYGIDAFISLYYVVSDYFKFIMDPFFGDFSSLHSIIKKDPPKVKKVDSIQLIMKKEVQIMGNETNIKNKQTLKTMELSKSPDFLFNFTVKFNLPNRSTSRFPFVNLYNILDTIKKCPNHTHQTLLEYKIHNEVVALVYRSVTGLKKKLSRLTSNPIFQLITRPLYTLFLLLCIIFTQHIFVQALMYYFPFGSQSYFQSSKLLMDHLISMEEIISTLIGYKFANKFDDLRPAQFPFAFYIVWNTVYYILLRFVKNMSLYLISLIHIPWMIFVLTLILYILEIMNMMKWYITKESINNFWKLTVMYSPYIAWIFSICVVVPVSVLLMISNSVRLFAWDLCTKLWRYMRVDISFNLACILFNSTDFLIPRWIRLAAPFPIFLHLDNGMNQLLLKLVNWVI